jgi:uncharacterized membrane protein
VHKHELDPVSLVAGLVFVMVAAGYTLSHTTSVRLHSVVLVPSVLVVVGAAVIAIVVRRMTAQPASDEPPTS